MKKEIDEKERTKLMCVSKIERKGSGKEGGKEERKINFLKVIGGREEIS